jgi:hypothetical protein
METQEILRSLPNFSKRDCLKIAEVALEIIQKEPGLTQLVQSEAGGQTGKTHLNMTCARLVRKILVL